VPADDDLAPGARARHQRRDGGDRRGQPHTHPLTNEAIPTLPSYQNLYFIIRVK